MFLYSENNLSKIRYAKKKKKTQKPMWAVIILGTVVIFLLFSDWLLPYYILYNILIIISNAKKSRDIKTGIFLSYLINYYYFSSCWKYS